MSKCSSSLSHQMWPLPRHDQHKIFAFYSRKAPLLIAPCSSSATAALTKASKKAPSFFYYLLLFLAFTTAPFVAHSLPMMPRESRELPIPEPTANTGFYRSSLGGFPASNATSPESHTTQGRGPEFVGKEEIYPASSSSTMYSPNGEKDATSFSNSEHCGYSDAYDQNSVVNHYNPCHAYNAQNPSKETWGGISDISSSENPKYLKHRGQEPATPIKRIIEEVFARYYNQQLERESNTTSSLGFPHGVPSTVKGRNPLNEQGSNDGSDLSWRENLEARIAKRCLKDPFDEDGSDHPQELSDEIKRIIHEALWQYDNEQNELKDPRAHHEEIKKSLEEIQRELNDTRKYNEEIKKSLENKYDFVAQIALIAASVAPYVLLFSTQPQPNASLDSLSSFVHVGNPGNLPDLHTAPPYWGGVPYEFEIEKSTVTIKAYLDFLNAKGVSDPHHLYNAKMSPFIKRLGKKGAYHYELVGRGDFPMTYVSYYTAQRYCNWNENGKKEGDTETGTYALQDLKPPELRGASLYATYRIMNNNEYQKVVYYDPHGSSSGVQGAYHYYPTQSDILPENDGAEDNPHGIHYGHVDSSKNILFPTGCYPKAVGSYGTLDDGSNLAQWTSSMDPVSGTLIIRGSDYLSDETFLRSDSFRRASPEEERANIGFRLVRVEPFPQPGKAEEAPGVRKNFIPGRRIFFTPGRLSEEDYQALLKLRSEPPWDQEKLEPDSPEEQEENEFWFRILQKDQEFRKYIARCNELYEPQKEEGQEWRYCRDLCNCMQKIKECLVEDLKEHRGYSEHPRGSEFWEREEAGYEKAASYYLEGKRVFLAQEGEFFSYENENWKNAGFAMYILQNALWEGGAEQGAKVSCYQDVTSYSLQAAQAYRAGNKSEGDICWDIAVGMHNDYIRDHPKPH